MLALLSGCFDFAPKRPVAQQFTTVEAGQVEEVPGVVIDNKPFSLDVIVDRPQSQGWSIVCFISTFNTPKHGVVTEVIAVDFKQRLIQHATIQHNGAYVWVNEKGLGADMPVPFLYAPNLISFHCNGRVDARGVRIHPHRRYAYNEIVKYLSEYDRKMEEEKKTKKGKK